MEKEKVKIDNKIREKLVLALDVDTLEEAKDLIIGLREYVGVFKVGLQLYTSVGNELINFMNENNCKYFLDVKLMDIPNTVEKSALNIVKRGASFFNVHTLGGRKMMESAKRAALSIDPKTIVLGVTILTSIDQDVLSNELGIANRVDDYVINLAKLAKDSGLDGVVASVKEAKKIKENLGSDFIVLSPGIRPVWSNKDDQSRIATPEFAFKQGCDFIVLGRAITKAQDPKDAIKKVYEELRNV